MIRLKQFDSLLIEDLDEHSFPLPYHGQNYNELVYIYKGCGIHILNNHRQPYESGDLLLISHDDTHHLQANCSTRIIAIKFTYDYFRSNRFCSFNDQSSYNPEAIFRNKYLKENKLIFSVEEQSFIRQIIDTILVYGENREKSSSSVIFYQILSIFGLISEVSSKMFIDINLKLPQKETVLTYIHQNIFEPEKIRIKQIAFHLNIASSYFSAYFKNNFGISYRDYINQYRISLIEQRLSSNQISMKEIAAEFGFADESHFSHYYKNRRGVTPTHYLTSLHSKE